MCAYSHFWPKISGDLVRRAEEGGSGEGVPVFISMLEAEKRSSQSEWPDVLCKERRESFRRRASGSATCFRFLVDLVI